MWRKVELCLCVVRFGGESLDGSRRLDYCLCISGLGD